MIAERKALGAGEGIEVRAESLKLASRWRGIEKGGDALAFCATDLVAGVARKARKEYAVIDGKVYDPCTTGDKTVEGLQRLTKVGKVGFLCVLAWVSGENHVVKANAVFSS